ncbi:MAG: hypothetical protein A2Z16_02270 [Chloroflexi bacterium RBG_16_54_18]|nr:MAG: hypothetical protein A2Z16_02270 [Chloroflexi bacterium RBG_16_54_18]
MSSIQEEHQSWLERPILASLSLNAEKIVFIVILVLTVITRLYGLGDRVMSHDENTHVYYSWRFFKGMGLQHDPLMHGTLQFHLIALTYFLFGDNDFTARLPHALFSIATVGFMWYYRRYLGRIGALLAAGMMFASPYMLFYGRYARNESLVAFFGVVSIWAILRYLETGRPIFMYSLTAATVLHFTSKETSFIYAAQALLFLGLYVIARITRLTWKRPGFRERFLVALFLLVSLMTILGGIIFFEKNTADVSPPALGEAPTPTTEMQPLEPAGLPLARTVLMGLSGILAALIVFFLLRGYTWKALCRERSFGMLVVLGTLVLPQLSAFPVSWIGKLLNDPVNWSIPTNATQVLALNMTNVINIAILVIPMTIISVVFGLLWNKREWLINAAIWYGLFTLFYTSTFTNGAGFFTGLVGSLGYWLQQQPVQRGSQPWYYYAAVQVPVYEFLPLLGTFLAFGIAAVREWKKAFRPREENLVDLSITAETSNGPVILPENPVVVEELERSAEFSEINPSPLAEPGLEPIPEVAVEEKVPALLLFGFWAVTSLVAYSVAGEKMPWLTVHIALPLILCAAWGYGQLIEGMAWSLFREKRGWLLLVLVFLLLVSTAGVLGVLLGPNPPLQGQTLDDLQVTSSFLLSLIVMALSVWGLWKFTRLWEIGKVLHLLVISFFVILAVLNMRTAYQSSFINYDNANELLVYAHSSGGVKQALAQIEEISQRTTNGLGLAVGYDNETTYPYWWYFRNFTNVRYFGTEPTRSLRDVTAILAGDANYGKVESVIGNSFHHFDYIRLWWPNQDYYNLTWERIWNLVKDPNMREAVFQIWLNRDYTRFGEITERDMSLPNWSPAARMRLYVRKDVAAQLWNYGVAPSEIDLGPQDPFTEEKNLELDADRIIGINGTEPGQFQRQRDLALGPDGSLYVADSENHRIQHLSPDGEVLQVWGQFGDITQGQAPAGSFNQPWGIAVAPDGSVYVTDTWNHRLQKFTPDGEFISMWGYFGQAETPQAFWGPRDVAVDSNGRVFITDTGNKRVVVFDGQGNFLTEFGTTGSNLGEFDEPVGIAIDQAGRVFVADTWNQRIQVFTETSPNAFTPSSSWDLVAWFGQSLDNKPFLAVDDKGNVFTVEPEGYRILWFGDTGQALFYWGDFGVGPGQFGLPGSIATDGMGGVWVSDTGNSRLMHFTLPAQGEP